MQSLFKLLLLAAFANAILWTALTPVWQNPDEQAHFAQVQDIAEFGERPTAGNDTSKEIAISEKILGTERDGFGNNKYTYRPEYRPPYRENYFGPFEEFISQIPLSERTNLVKKEATLNPPLYYFLGSILYKADYNGNLFERVYAVRTLSLMFFIGTIILSYQAGKIIFNKNKYLPLILASFLAFKPMLVSTSLGVLPDPATNFFFTAILLICLRVIKEKLKIKLIFLTGIVIFLGLLTRQQFAIAIPILILALIINLIKNREIFKNFKFISIFLTLLVIGILIVGRIFPGLGYLAGFSTPEVGRPDISALFSATFINQFIWTLKNTISQTLPWYWGVYKWLSLTVDPIHYQIINRILVISAVGITFRILLALKNRQLNLLDQHLIFMVFASIFYYLVIVIWDYYFWLDHKFSFGIQGRYFFPLVVFHLAIILIGLVSLLKYIPVKLTKIIFIALVIMMVLFNISSLMTVASSNYDISSISMFIAQSSQYKPMLIKGNGLYFFLVLAFALQMTFIVILGKHLFQKSLDILFDK